MDEPTRFTQDLFRKMDHVPADVAMVCAFLIFKTVEKGWTDWKHLGFTAEEVRRRLARIEEAEKSNSPNEDL